MVVIPKCGYREIWGTLYNQDTLVRPIVIHFINQDTSLIRTLTGHFVNQDTSLIRTLN